MTNFESKRKPTKIREWIAWWLVKLAKKIYPDSEAVISFYMGIMHDYLINGKAIVKIQPDEIFQKVDG